MLLIVVLHVYAIMLMPLNSTNFHSTAGVNYMYYDLARFVRPAKTFLTIDLNDYVPQRIEC